MSLNKNLCNHSRNHQYNPYNKILCNLCYIHPYKSNRMTLYILLYNNLCKLCHIQFYIRLCRILCILFYMSFYMCYYSSDNYGPNLQSQNKNRSMNQNKKNRNLHHNQLDNFPDMNQHKNLHTSDHKLYNNYKCNTLDRSLCIRHILRSVSLLLLKGQLTMTVPDHPQLGVPFELHF